MISQFFILTDRGDRLILKDCRDFGECSLSQSVLILPLLPARSSCVWCVRGRMETVLRCLYDRSRFVICRLAERLPIFSSAEMVCISLSPRRFGRISLFPCRWTCLPPWASRYWAVSSRSSRITAECWRKKRFARTSLWSTNCWTKRSFPSLFIFSNPQDFGYPQDTSSEALVQFVHNKPVVIADPKVFFL